MSEWVHDVGTVVIIVASSLTIVFSCRTIHWARVAARYNRETDRILREMESLRGGPNG